jgi:Asp/Glu/hydantoin racemase
VPISAWSNDTTMRAGELPGLYLGRRHYKRKSEKHCRTTLVSLRADNIALGCGFMEALSIMITSMSQPVCVSLTRDHGTRETRYPRPNVKG